MAGKTEVLKDHRTQAFLNKLMSNDLHVIYPVFDAKYGYRYLNVEGIAGDPPSDDEFLVRLFKAGVLRRELYDKVIFCPNCGSANVSTRYCCPYCKSFDVERSSLIEHVHCGYIDIEDKFMLGEKLVCPRCHSELTKRDVDYTRAGVWCTCNGCGKSFDVPIPYHFCRQCRQRLPFEEAVYKNVYSYSLNQDAIREEALEWTMIAPIRQFLEERGFKVENPGFLEGKSGVKHMFDVVAHGKGTARNIIVIQLATSSTDEPVSEQSIIEMFAKVYDSSIDKAFLIAVPKLSENGKRLVDFYKINLIEVKKPVEALTALESLISSQSETEIKEV